MVQASDDDVMQRCLALPWEACLALYADLFSSAPEATATVAMALREKARSGDLPSDIIPLLSVFVVDAPNPETLSQLAKALAAFGRKAQMAEPYLMDRLRSFNITSDETLWAFDGCLHALSFIGGDASLAFIDELDAKDPPPVLRSRSVYKGRIPEQDRVAIFRETLDVMHARLTREELDGWVKKRTDKAAVVAAPPKKTAPWMTR